MGFNNQVIEGFSVVNNSSPLVFIDSMQGNVRTVTSLANAATEIPNDWRYTGMIIKDSSSQRYYMYTANDVSGFGTTSNWTQINSSGGGGSGGDGAPGASAYEVWQTIAGNESGTVEDFIKSIAGTTTTSGDMATIPSSPSVGDLHILFNGNVYAFDPSHPNAQATGEFIGWYSTGTNLKGTSGTTGTPGTPGLPGPAGTSLQSISVDSGGFLSMSLSDSTQFTFGPITGSDGQDGRDGSGVIIQGTDTAVNILTKQNQLPGYLWISSTIGSDSSGIAIAIGDGVVYGSNGLWSAVGPLRGEQGVSGTPGIDGVNGTQWFSSAGTPSDESGANFDFYYDSTNNDIYRKIGGAWGAPIADLTVPGYTDATYNSSTGMLTVTNTDASLTREIGPIKGAQGAAGSIDSVNIQSLAVGETAFIRNDGTSQNADLVFGIPQATPGEPGLNGVGIKTIVFNTETNNLDITTTDNSITSIGPVKGAAGISGATINTARVNGDNIEFTLTDDSTVVLEDVIPQLVGEQGDAGAKITSVAFDGDDIIFTLEDSSTARLTDGKLDLKGDTGDAGSGVTILGTKIIADITSSVNPNAGDMYIAADSGDVNGVATSQGDGVVYSGTAWTTIGAIQGPRGEQGVDGTPGSPGGPGPSGNPGPPGAYVSQSYFDNDDLIFKLSNNDLVTLDNALNVLTGSTLHANGPFTASTISASSTITANAFIGDGSQLTGVLGEGDFITTQGSASLTSITASGDISASGVVSANTLTANNLVFTQGATSIKIEAPDESVSNNPGADLTIEAGDAFSQGDRGGDITLQAGSGDGYPQLNNYGGDITLNAGKGNNAVSSGSIHLNAPYIYANGTFTASTIALPGIPNLSASVAAAVAGGDDLGNHTAVQNLNLSNFDIVNADDIQGTNISSSGDITASGTVYATNITANNIIFKSGSSDVNIKAPDIEITGIISDQAPGAGINIKAADAYGPYRGGDISITAGKSSGTGNYGGDIKITAGQYSFADSNHSGSVFINSKTLDIDSDITASGLISASGNLSANNASLGEITSSGNISASGHLFISSSLNTDTDLKTLMYNTITGQIFHTGSYSSGTGTGDGIFTTDGSVKKTTSNLNISGSLDVHTSSNDIVTYNNETGELDSKPILTLEGNTFYTGDAYNNLFIQHNDLLSKNWFTFTGGIPRLGINTSTPKANIHISASIANQPEILLESGSTKLSLGVNRVGESFISASNLEVTGSLTVKGDINFPTDTQFILSGNGATQLFANSDVMVIKHGSTSINKSLIVSSSLIVEGEESKFRNRVIIPELVIFPRTSDTNTYTETLYNTNGELYWKGKKILTTAHDNKIPSTGFYSPMSMDIFTTDINSRITIATGKLDVRAPIQSSRGASLEINSPLGLPVYNSEAELLAVPTASMRGGEMVTVIPQEEVSAEQGVLNLSAEYGFYICNYYRESNPATSTNVCMGYKNLSIHDWIDDSDGKTYINLRFIVNGVIEPHTMRGSHKTGASSAPDDADGLLLIPALYRPRLNSILRCDGEYFRVASIHYDGYKRFKLKLERGYNNSPEIQLNILGGSDWHIHWSTPFEPAGVTNMYVFDSYQQGWKLVQLGDSILGE